jgi:hypothetical protein
MASAMPAPVTVRNSKSGLRCPAAASIFWADRTKAGKRRVAALPPRVVAALGTLPHRAGPVFLSDKGRPYADRRGAYGGQIKKLVWRIALGWARSRADPARPAAHLGSWHYTLNRDLLALKQEGGWSSVTLVERPAHLLPPGYDAAIRRFLGWHQAGTDPQAAQARA